MIIGHTNLVALFKCFLEWVSPFFLKWNKFDFSRIWWISTRDSIHEAKKKKKEIFVENNVSKSKRPNKILSKKLILCKLLSDLLIPVFKIVRNKIAILDSQSINYSSLYCKVTCFCRLFNYYQSILKEYNFCWIQITEIIFNRNNWFITFSVTIFAFAITYVSWVSLKSNSLKQSG